MNPYLFTITFLLMMSFLTSSEVIRFSQHTLENSCYTGSCAELAAAEELQEYSHLEELRGEESSNPKKRKKKEPQQKAAAKRIAKLNVNTARPPNNSRLNIYTLVHKEGHEQLPEDYSLYETTARLMRTLYPDLCAELPGAEYFILDKLMEKKKESATFETPDELSSLSLEDPKLQELFFRMLKGTKTARPLLHYITFDKIDSPRKQSRKINFLFTDPLILRAIFPEPRIADKLLARREHIWQEILEQEKYRLEMAYEEGKGRAQFGEDLANVLMEVLVSEGRDAQRYKTHVFDCTLSEPGNIIFLEDSQTKEIRREKYIPLAKPKKNN